VYAFGPKQAPFCMGCAMVAGGVRSAGSLPAVSRRELRARMKAQRAAMRAARDADLIPEPEDETPSVPTGATDWASPWWEDRQPTMAD